MFRKIFSAWLLVLTFLFAQIASAADIDAAKNLSEK